MKKLVFVLIIVAALLVVAMPAAAQGPVLVQTTDQGLKPIYVVKAGTNEDPFGGLPLSTSSGLGSATKFGLGQPGVFLIPGGKPSNLSGDGSTPRKSIYIGGAWDNDGKELPTCATVVIPAGGSKWFKMDTWKNRWLQLWVDDELNAATSPSGTAVFGAADGYTQGQTPGSTWLKNAVSDKWGQTSYKTYSGPFADGIVAAIYDPDNMQPNFAFAPPNAALYTTNGSRSGQGLKFPGNGLSQSNIVGSDIHGYATYNPNKTDHLLWFDAKMDGWVHARVRNQMIWDATVSVCSYRSIPGGS
jgi:hypothetical protein